MVDFCRRASRLPPLHPLERRLQEARLDVSVRATVAPYVPRDVDTAVEDRDAIAKDFPNRLSLPKVSVTYKSLN